MNESSDGDDKPTPSGAGGGGSRAFRASTRGRPDARFDDPDMPAFEAKRSSRFPFDDEEALAGEALDRLKRRLEAQDPLRHEDGQEARPQDGRSMTSRSVSRSFDAKAATDVIDDDDEDLDIDEAITIDDEEAVALDDRFEREDAGGQEVYGQEAFGQDAYGQDAYGQDARDAAIDRGDDIDCDDTIDRDDPEAPAGFEKRPWKPAPRSGNGAVLTLADAWRVGSSEDAAAEGPDAGSEAGSEVGRAGTSLQDLLDEDVDDGRFGDAEPLASDGLPRGREPHAPARSWIDGPADEPDDGIDQAFDQEPDERPDEDPSEDPLEGLGSDPGPAGLTVDAPMAELAPPAEDTAAATLHRGDALSAAEDAARSDSEQEEAGQEDARQEDAEQDDAGQADADRENIAQDDRAVGSEDEAQSEAEHAVDNAAGERATTPGAAAQKPLQPPLPGRLDGILVGSLSKARRVISETLTDQGRDQPAPEADLEAAADCPDDAEAPGQVEVQVGGQAEDPVEVHVEDAQDVRASDAQENADDGENDDEGETGDARVSSDGRRSPDLAESAAESAAEGEAASDAGHDAGETPQGEAAPDETDDPAPESQSAEPPSRDAPTLPGAPASPLRRNGERRGRSAVPLTLVKAMFHGQRAPGQDRALGAQAPSDETGAAAESAPTEAPMAARPLRDAPPASTAGAKGGAKGVGGVSEGGVAEGSEPEEPDEAALAEARRLKEEEDRAFIEGNSIGALFIGARATLGKHDLKAVERELRIKARYLEAIEAIDPDRLPLDAYLPGYVKAYARYLHSELPLGPEEAYEKFRAELDAKLIALGRAPAAPSAARAAAAAAGAELARRNASASPAERIAEEAERRRTAAPKAGPVAGRTLDPLGAIRKAARGGGTAGSGDPVAARRAAGEMAGRIAKARAAARRNAAGQNAASQEPFLKRFAPVAAAAASIAVVVGLGFAVWSVLTEAQRVAPSAPPDARALRVIERRDSQAVASSTVDRPSAAVYADGAAMTTLYRSEPEETGTIDETLAPGAVTTPDGVSDPVPATDGISAARQQAPAGESAAQPDPAPSAGLPAGPPVALPSAPTPNPPPARAQEADPRPEAAAAEPAPSELPGARAAGPAFGIFAIEDSWLRVRDSKGRELLSGILAAGATASLPADRGFLEVRAGNAGGVAFVVDGVRYGPIGARGKVEQLWIGPGRVAERYPKLAPPVR